MFVLSNCSHMENKGITEEAKLLAKGVGLRFAKFISNKGLSSVAEKSGFHYSALRNSAIGKYNPSLETIFQVKLAYGKEFDDVYVFTGQVGEVDAGENKEDILNKDCHILERQILLLQDRIMDKDQQIQDLKRDKEFLQSLIKRNNNT